MLYKEIFLGMGHFLRSTARFTMQGHGSYFMFAAKPKRGGVVGCKMVLQVSPTENWSAAEPFPDCVDLIP